MSYRSNQSAIFSARSPRTYKAQTEVYTRCILPAGYASSITGYVSIRQIGQGTTNEVNLLNLREELYRKEEKYENEKTPTSFDAKSTYSGKSRVIFLFSLGFFL